MEAFVSTMTFCEAPFEGTLAPPVPVGNRASTSGPKKIGGDTLTMSSLVAAVTGLAKHRLSSQPQPHREREPRVAAMGAFASTMAFCEAPFEGTLAPRVPAGDRASTSGPKKSGDDAVTMSSLVAAVTERAKHCLSSQPHPHQERRVAAMGAFASTMAFCEAPFEGTLAPPVPAGNSASTSDPKKSSGDAVTMSSLVRQQQPQKQKHGTVDGLAIFETIVLD